MRRGILLALLVVGLASKVAAQQQTGPYVGATFNGLSHLDSIGSSFTSPNGALVIGGAGARIGAEFEASVGGSTAGDHSYACCGGNDIVNVLTSTHDSFFLLQLKGRGRIFEPSAGIGFVFYKITRHATATSTRTGLQRPYFDDTRSDGALVATAGLDAAVKVTTHLYFVPSARLIFSLDDQVAADAHAGRLRLRYGAGLRVAF